MHPTKIDITQNIRAAIIEELNAVLADTIDLHAQVKQAHWTVKGPHFIGLHELFDQIAAAVEAYSDLVAERIEQLGGTAMGTVQQSAKRTRLPAYDTNLSDGADHVEALSSGLAAYGRHLRAAIDKSQELGDADAADICTEISRGIDKFLWFVEAHQQAPA